MEGDSGTRKSGRPGTSCRQAAVVVAGVFVALTIGLKLWLVPGYTRVAFSGNTWRNATPEQRGHMVADLMRSRQLVGRSHAEVTALLGPGDLERETLVIYDVGHMGWREGVPFVFTYSLLLQFRDGLVVSQRLDD